MKSKMNRVVRGVLTVLMGMTAALFFIGCDAGGSSRHASTPPPPPPFKPIIMPLGDSITYDDAQYYIEHPVPAGERVAYRQELWYMLEDVNYSAELDFVGTQKAGYDVEPPIDPDNEGHPGWTSYNIAARIYDWLMVNPANIILLHIGTNDGIASADGVRQILDEINRFEEDHVGWKIHVFVAEIIDRQQHDPTIAAFNQDLKNLVEERIANDENLTLVDMYHDAGLNSDDYLENTHPNKSGYKKMAEVWFNALIQYKEELEAAGEIAPSRR